MTEIAQPFGFHNAEPMVRPGLRRDASTGLDTLRAPMLNWLTRYKPVVDALTDLRATSAVDVGSGAHGLGRYWDGSVLQTDLAFVDQPPPTSNVAYVAASVEHLPLSDSSFDCAVSLDTMEHLPQALRPLFVEEMARVARRAIIIGFPSGPLAKTTDRVYATLMRLTPGLEVGGWLREHLDQERYPDRSTVVDSLPTDWQVVREIRSGNALLSLIQVYIEALPRYGLRISNRLERRYRERPYPRALDFPPTIRGIFIAAPR